MINHYIPIIFPLYSHYIPIIFPLLKSPTFHEPPTMSAMAKHLPAFSFSHGVHQDVPRNHVQLQTPHRSSCFVELEGAGSRNAKWGVLLWIPEKSGGYGGYNMI